MGREKKLLEFFAYRRRDVGQRLDALIFCRSCNETVIAESFSFLGLQNLENS